MWLLLLMVGCAVRNAQPEVRALPGPAAALAPAGPTRPASVAVEVPPQSLDGGLLRSDVDQALQAALPQMESCYLRALDRVPGLEGWLEAEIIVDGAGEYTEIVRQRESPGIDTMSTCLRFAWMEVAFPVSRSGEASGIRLVLRFDDGDDGNNE